MEGCLFPDGLTPALPGFEPRLGRGSLSRTPPQLVVEVLSPRPRDVRRDRLDKRSEYARFGVKLSLLVDPEVRLLELFELGADGRYVLDASASGGKMTLPGCEGLELDLDALWAEAAWVVGDEAESETERDVESTDERDTL